jgi:hypothetical protein
MPNASSAIPDARVAYTTYSFTWPENGTLNNALFAELNSTSGNYYIESQAYILSGLFPSNVSDKWDPNSSDCTSALGSECVAKLTLLNKNGGGVDLRQACPDTFGVTPTSDASQSAGDFTQGGGELRDPGPYMPWWLDSDN